MSSIRIDTSNPEHLKWMVEKAIDHLLSPAYVGRVMAAALSKNASPEAAETDLRRRMVEQMAQFVSGEREFDDKEVSAVFSACIALKIVQHVVAGKRHE